MFQYFEIAENKTKNNKKLIDPNKDLLTEYMELFMIKFEY